MQSGSVAGTVVARVVLVGFIAALMVTGSGTAASAALSAKCSGAHTKTVFRQGSVRVFSKLTRLKGEREPYRLTYACKRFPFRLPISDFPGEDRYYHFSTAGNYIGYAVDFSCAACDVIESEVYVHDLRTGKAVIHHVAFCGVSSDDAVVTRLTVTRNGQVTWTASGTENDANSTKLTQTVRMQLGSKRCQTL